MFPNSENMPNISLFYYHFHVMYLKKKKEKRKEKWETVQSDGRFVRAGREALTPVAVWRRSASASGCGVLAMLGARGSREPPSFLRLSLKRSVAAHMYHGFFFWES